MICQKVLKAFIEISNNNKEEKNICLEVKKPAIQVSSLTISILILETSQPAGSDILLPAISSSRIFANIKNANIYDKFMIADNKI